MNVWPKSTDCPHNKSKLLSTRQWIDWKSIYKERPAERRGFLSNKKVINMNGTEINYEAAVELIDELVEAVKILHPRMYTTFIDKVQDL